MNAAVSLPIILLLAALAAILVLIGIFVISKMTSSKSKNSNETVYQQPHYDNSDQGWREPGKTDLHLDKGRRMWAGVCAGLALRYDWDPSIVRLVFAASFIVGFGMSVIIYIALWLLLPNLQPPAGV